MDMKLLESMCKELGVKINEEWQGNDGEFYRITRTGIEVLFPECVKSEYSTPSRWIHSTVDIYNSILTGKLKPTWKPMQGEMYWIVDFYEEEMVYCYRWSNSNLDNRVYKRGLIFKTEEEATEVANKMLGVVKNIKREEVS